MPRADLRQALSRRVLLCDGAMGTQLFARGLQPGACGEKWNIDRPEVLEAIHHSYREAGCQLITTNTFGASGPSLEKHGLAGQVAAVNRAGALVARRVAGDDAWVLGDIGPFGGFLEPLGEMKADDLLAVFVAQATALREGGADAAIVETMTDPAELSIAVRAAKAVADWPVIATCAFDKAGDGFRTMMGASVADAMKAAIDAGADVVGANCGTSLSLGDYQRLAAQLVAAAGRTPVILQPNAGFPSSVDGKLVYPATPADMAAIVPGLVQTGLRVLGGCCGTSPDHLRAMGEALRRDHA